MIIFGCRTENSDSEILVTGIKSLDLFTKSVPFQTIKLDDHGLKKVYLNETNFIYRITEKDTSLVFISEVWKDEHIFYIYDFIQFGIYTIDQTTGELSGPHTKKGRGPGEYLNVSDIAVNTDFIYLQDGLGQRINRYNADLNYMDEYIPDDGLKITGSLDANDRYLLSENSNPDKSDDLIMVYELPLMEVKDPDFTFMPRLVPVGYEPSTLNNVQFSINKHSEVVASYKLLPRLYLFANNFSDHISLILSHTQFDALEKVDLEIRKPLPGQRYGGQFPVIDFTLLNSGNIIISLRSELIFLKKNPKDTYSVVERITFEPSQPLHEESFTWKMNYIIGLDDTKNRLYLYNSKNIFFIDISEIY